MSNNGVVIVAAGRSERMGNLSQDGPKQYRLIGGKSVLQWTAERFCNHENIDWVQVVIQIGRASCRERV